MKFSNYRLAADLAQRVGRISIINSLDDSEDIHKTVLSLRAAMPEARYIELDGYGHFMIGNKMRDAQFPVLLGEVIAA